MNNTKITKNIVLKYDSTNSLYELIINESNKKKTKHLTLTKIYSEGEANFIEGTIGDLSSKITTFIKKWHKEGIAINDVKQFDAINQIFIDLKNNNFNSPKWRIPYIDFKQLYIVKDKNEKNDILSILYISYSGKNHISRTIYTYSMLAKGLSMDSIATIAINQINNVIELSCSLLQDSFLNNKKNNLFNHYVWEFKSNISTSLDFAILMPYIMYLDTQISRKIFQKKNFKGKNYFALTEYKNELYKSEEIQFIIENYNFKYFSIYYLNTFTNNIESYNGWLFTNSNYKKEYLTSTESIISDMTIKRKKKSLLVYFNFKI